jgi:predicted metalloprotease with PDZ domain
MMMQDVPVVVPGDARIRFGIRVNMVVANSPAVRGGLQAADQVVGVDDRIWLQPGACDDFSKWVRAHKPGARVTLHIVRGQNVEDLTVELARRPPMKENDFPPMVGGLPDWAALQQQAQQQAKDAKDANFHKWLTDRKASRRAK